MSVQYINAFEKEAAYKLNQKLTSSLQSPTVADTELVILCIGTDRTTGDCLGPLVGNFLKQELPELPIYGTLQNPVHALNLEQITRNIYKDFSNPYIIAIDASLGVPEHIGYITLSQTPLFPGKGVNKKLPAIGDFSITGIVNVTGFPNSVLLQSTRLHTVVTLANCIGNALYWYFANDMNTSRKVI